MYFSFREICSKNLLTDIGVLHVGAHLGEERGEYHEAGVRKVVWVDANADLCERLRALITNEPLAGMVEIVIEAAIADQDGQQALFHVASNPQCSSLLDFKMHSKNHPSITVEETLSVNTRTLASLVHESPGDFRSLNFLNLDIQGMELAAIKGLGERLKEFQCINTEVNVVETYDGNAYIWDIDRLLAGFAFYRVATSINDEGWGDAVYIRKDLNWFQHSLYLLRAWTFRVRVSLRQTAWRAYWLLVRAKNSFRNR